MTHPHIPTGSQKIALKDGSATFYLFADTQGRPSVFGYLGKSQKPKRYYFGSESNRIKWMEKVAKAQADRNRATAERRAERNKPHTLEPGDILYTSWGYDQTNVEFYKVVSCPSKCYVEIQEISAPLINGEDGFMTGRRFPDPDKANGQPFKRKVDMSSGKPSIKVNSVATAWVWDGKEKRVSWYA